MGRYKEKHSSESAYPLDPLGVIGDITGDIIKKTELEDTKTGDKAIGVGRTREEADKDAFKRLKEADENDSNFTKGSSGSESSNSSSGSICYLTTACVKSMGLPDNCLELNILRNFRDRILLAEPFGRKGVREYYRIAPEIVQAIEEQNNSHNIWQVIYKDIRRAVSLIFSSDFERAFKHYQQMTLRLKEKYID